MSVYECAFDVFLHWSARKGPLSHTRNWMMEMEMKKEIFWLSLWGNDPARTRLMQMNVKHGLTAHRTLLIFVCIASTIITIISLALAILRFLWMVVAFVVLVVDVVIFIVFVIHSLRRFRLDDMIDVGGAPPNTHTHTHLLSLCKYYGDSIACITSFSSAICFSSLFKMKANCWS